MTCLLISLLITTASHAGASDKNHHNPAKNTCLSCHSAADEKKLRALLTTALDSTEHNKGADNKCNICHREKGIDIKLPAINAIAAMDERFLQQAKSVRLQLPTRIYYQGSVLGEMPNPLIKIAAGKFIMGSDIRLPDEGPQHEVALNDFLIDKYEVTNLQYQRFIDDSDRRSPSHFRNRKPPQGKADHPVTFVSWYDARDYCLWADKRLPTDQEWEKAARGTDGRMFPWGNEFDVNSANTPLLWIVANKQGDTMPVHIFKSGISPYGLYNMSGNVWEWTSSWYQPYPGNKHMTQNYGKKYKTLKGGSWWDCSFYQCGVSAPLFNRSFFNRKVKNQSFGFRCAKDV